MKTPIKDYLFSDAYCSSELLAAIGRVAVESSYLERYIESALYALTKLEREVGAHWVEGQMIGSKIDALEYVGTTKLAKRSARNKERFKAAIENLRRVNSARNRVIHGLWMTDVEIKNYLALMLSGSPIPPAVAIKRGKPGKPDVKTKASEAMMLAREINHAQEELHDALWGIWPKLLRAEYERRRQSRREKRGL